MFVLEEIDGELAGLIGEFFHEGIDGWDDVVAKAFSDGDDEEFFGGIGDGGEGQRGDESEENGLGEEEARFHGMVDRVRSGEHVEELSGNVGRIQGWDEMARN
jgi:hypothetical protein